MFRLSVLILYCFLTTPIFGDNDTSFAVLLGYKSKYGTIYACGGALIEENVVLTSLSCWNIPGLSSPIIVKTSLNENIYINTTEKVHQNDLIKLFLTNKSMVKPGCISENKFNGKYAEIVGFGSLSLDNMVHLSVNNKSNIMKVFVYRRDNAFIIQSDGNDCYADKGGAVIIRNNLNVVQQFNKESCQVEIIGILTNWVNCGEKNSKGNFIVIRN